MGQCVSTKAGAVIAASGYSSFDRIMDKKSSKHKILNKKKDSTKGTDMSLKKNTNSGLPIPIGRKEASRSKSVGPDRYKQKKMEDDFHFTGPTRHPGSASGRSTPRLAPPKKEASGVPLRTNRFGFRTPNQRFTDKVTDISYNNFVKNIQQPKTGYGVRKDQTTCRSYPQSMRPQSSPINQRLVNDNYKNNNVDFNKRTTDTVVAKYTLQSSNLPRPQVARMAKFTKTAVNQSRRAGTSYCSSKDGSSTEDSGLGSQNGVHSIERSARRKVRKLGVVVKGKKFDVVDTDEDDTITEISVIPLPEDLCLPIPVGRSSPKVNRTTGTVRERTNLYQKNLQMAKDNKLSKTSSLTVSMTSSMASSEGCGEEVKVMKDAKKSEKFTGSAYQAVMAAMTAMTESQQIPESTSSSSDEQDQFGNGGEALFDMVVPSSEEEPQIQRIDDIPMKAVNTVSQSTSEHFQTITNVAKTGALPSSTLRSVLLSIEDPAFAAVAATTTAMIDDETSPLENFTGLDSPNSTFTQLEIDLDNANDNCEAEQLDAESPVSSNSGCLSVSVCMSEGKDFFDDEIEDQPGLMFADNEDMNFNDSLTISDIVACIKNKNGEVKANESVESSPRLTRKTEIADSLSSCDSIASDDLMMDYEPSEADSCENVMQSLEDATSMLQLDSIINIANNNINEMARNNQNEIDLANSRSRLQQLNSRSGTDSPRSLDSTRSRQIYSPLRTPTQIGTKLPIPLDISSPRDEDLVTIDRTTLNNCYHDIVTMKTIILKLKRVIQEPGENGLTRNFPLTPFEVQNGLSDLIEPSLEDTVDTMGTTTCSESSTDSHHPVKVSVSTQTPVSDSAHRRLSSATPDSAHVKLDNDEVLQLKKQVQICKAKLQEKDAEIFKLKADVQEYQLHHGRIQGIRYSPDESLCTPSEKLRPASLLPPLSNNSSSTGSLASSNGSSTRSSTPRSSPPMPRQQKSIPTRIQEPMRSSLPSLQRLQYPRPVKTLQSPESPQMRKSLLPTPPLAAKRTTAAAGIPKARAHSAPRR
ncbi:uncharacterized protein LOC106649544 isoform X3 [Trichogramma pretiosum]|uniref:uncharacterized protein LOC106649544 isoform X3 n=1 Tax=Trichogramma pretiosum TaxID=7493 RepID=UPI0006C94608|nr:uncharacterized protein LOC106649544 isoform X3 [Trichogramma pretiosum]